jgi:hypothetical protein
LSRHFISQRDLVFDDDMHDRMQLHVREANACALVMLLREEDTLCLEPFLRVRWGVSRMWGGRGRRRYDRPIGCWLGVRRWRGSCAWLKQGSMVRHGPGFTA